MRLLPALVLLTLVAGCDDPPCGDWSQWGADPTHSGHSCVQGQLPKKLLDDVTFDPFVPQEVAEAEGDLVIHYQAPLIVDDDLYMEVKSGSYVSCDPPGSGMPAGCGPPGTWSSEVWNERHFKIGSDGKLREDWTFASDWQPEPVAGFEPLFHAVVAGDFLYVPGAGGTVHKLDRRSGQHLAQLNPFGDTVDGSIYVAGALSADRHGAVYYNAIRISVPDVFAHDAEGWLVRIDPQDHARTVGYGTLVPDAPAPDALCTVGYPTKKYKPPYPPLAADGSLVPPDVAPCLSQRPAFNVAPAIGIDGTIYTVSHAHANTRYSYLVAVRPDLTPWWATSLRGLVQDGCGVLVPLDGDATMHPRDCTPGAPMGIDPRSGEMPAMQALDSGTSSPVLLPDGNILYGAWSGYNISRGHLLKFSPVGKFLGSFDFGWDVTPGIDLHDGTYSILVKDNHYNFDDDGNDLGPYYLTRLRSDLVPEWRFLSTNMQSCSRGSDGNVSCMSDHAHGFEWCINAPAVDRDGRMFANGEDGVLYALDRDGHELASLFLNEAQGAAYTPLALDRRGHVFALNGGHLSVAGE